jgi:hypothetical protein
VDIYDVDKNKRATVVYDTTDSRFITSLCSLTPFQKEEKEEKKHQTKTCIIKPCSHGKPVVITVGKEYQSNEESGNIKYKISTIIKQNDDYLLIAEIIGENISVMLSSNDEEEHALMCGFTELVESDSEQSQIKIYCNGVEKTFTINEFYNISENVPTHVFKIIGHSDAGKIIITEINDGYISEPIEYNINESNFLQKYCKSTIAKHVNFNLTINGEVKILTIGKIYNQPGSDEPGVKQRRITYRVDDVNKSVYGGDNITQLRTTKLIEGNYQKEQTFTTNNQSDLTQISSWVDSEQPQLVKGDSVQHQIKIYCGEAEKTFTVGKHYFLGKKKPNILYKCNEITLDEDGSSILHMNSSEETIRLHELRDRDAICELIDTEDTQMGGRRAVRANKTCRLNNVRKTANKAHRQLKHKRETIKARKMCTLRKPRSK